MSLRNDRPTVALIDWCHLIEDFLDNLGVSCETFQQEFEGSWIFGYMRAFQAAGVRPIFFCVSARVTSPWRFTHRPTGCLICVLPAPRVYRAIRRRVPNPYATSVDQAVGLVGPVSRLFYTSLLITAPYLSTPLKCFARELRRERCTAILCQEYENPRFDICTLLGRLTNLPVFATFQGGQIQYSPIERLFRRQALRSCAGLVVGSTVESQRLQQRYDLPPSKISRIFNPIDVAIWRRTNQEEARKELGIPADARVVIWHGRVLFRRKGLDVLLDAWERVCRDRPNKNLMLILLGSGNDANELCRRIEATQLQNVRWVNKFLSDTRTIVRYLSAADVYAFPSRHEGFPVAPLEAMSAGLPLVAAKAPGIADIFENGEGSGGLIVPVADVTAFAGALGRLLDEDSWGRELGGRAQNRVQTSFSIEAIGAQLAALLCGGGL